MTALQISEQEERLLFASLHPDGVVAATKWKEWASEVELEHAPYPELRLLPAAYAHLRRVAPSLKLPNKLRGKARATFAKNSLLAVGCLPVIEELSRHSHVVLAKGLAICIRFDAWTSRAMGDVDIHIPFASFEKACETLAELGWMPKYGMTWRSLMHRNAFRRNSWNVTKGENDLDLHWRIGGGPAEDRLARVMWESTERAEFLGRTVMLPSNEFATVTALEHGFKSGTHGDLLQTIVDAASLLSLCKRDRLRALLDQTDLLDPFQNLLSVLTKLGRSDVTSQFSDAGALPAGMGRGYTDEVQSSKETPLWKRRLETPVLRRPFCYRMWEWLGRKARIERLLVRWTGPFSKPPAYSGAFKDEYDLRDCAMIDQIGGPGWGWPDPERTCSWSDRSDARLLIPLSRVADHLIVLGLADNRHYSLNTRVDVFANGVYLSTLNISERLAISDHCLLVPRQVLFGAWVELSLRPQPYLGDESDAYDVQRSVPVERLRIFDMEQMSDIFSAHKLPQLYFAALNPEDSKASKFERIRTRIANSPYRNHPDLPDKFNPISYVLCHSDLFEHEVDPYEHFLNRGRLEGRAWH